MLLVEDDVAVRDLTARVLKAQGYTVLTAADGEDGLRVAATYPERIHLVITDMVMPTMGGDTLVTQLAVMRPTSTIIVLSGYAAARLDAGALGNQVAAFFEKPVTPEQLTHIVRTVLDRNAPNAP